MSFNTRDSESYECICILTSKGSSDLWVYSHSKPTYHIIYTQTHTHIKANIHSFKTHIYSTTNNVLLWDTTDGLQKEVFSILTHKHTHSVDMWERVYTILLCGQWPCSLLAVRNSSIYLWSSISVTSTHEHTHIFSLSSCMHSHKHTHTWLEDRQTAQPAGI